MYSDATPDYQNMLVVNVPAALIVLSGVFVVDFLSNFSITYLIELPKPWGFLFLWVILLPSIYGLSSGLTGVILRDWVILKAPCPNCGESNKVFFGDIFTTKGPKATADTDCPKCQSLIRFDNTKRLASVERIGPDPAAAAKKARDALPLLLLMPCPSSCPADPSGAPLVSPQGGKKKAAADEE